MRYMLDTNVCIGLIRRRPEPLLRNLHDNQTEDLVISAVTLAELQRGVEKSANPPRNQLALAGLLTMFEVLPLDSNVAIEYGRLAALLEIKGQRIGDFDTLIAAHALSNHYTLVTHNTRHFAQVPGLHLVDWEISNDGTGSDDV